MLSPPFTWMFFFSGAALSLPFRICQTFNILDIHFNLSMGVIFQVRLGGLKKNENKIDEMVDICQFLHKYVPGHSTETENMPTKCLSGGDYLTYGRHKKAQSTMQDSRTPSERLEGLQAKFEEFHTQAEVNKVRKECFVVSLTTTQNTCS